MSAKDMYDVCMRIERKSDPLHECAHDVREFFLECDVDRFRNLQSAMLTTVPGSRQIHHIRVLDRGVLATRQYSCFCVACLSGSYDECDSSAVVGGWDPSWDVVKLAFSGPESVLPTVQPHQDRAPQNVPHGNQDTSVGDRLAFFQSVTDELKGARSFVDVRGIVRQQRDGVERFELPEPVVHSSLQSRPADDIAMHLLPSDVQERCKPLAVDADGNCFFRAESLLLFGNEGHHLELRC
ncbi:hypothetical protein BaRGS_00031910 [Batillaria attramentaria]|uniref:OTU domain-containing protein n=1 Tax=Batillaria attramentaria TaxID=370345 RepID=A0ABD0JP47_9CAEN